MKVIEVIDTLKISGNTSLVVKDDGKDLKNGIGILDDKGVPHVVLSVAMSRPDMSVENAIMNTTVILVEGTIDSKRIFV